MSGDAGSSGANPVVGKCGRHVGERAALAAAFAEYVVLIYLGTALDEVHGTDAIQIRAVIVVLVLVVVVRKAVGVVAHAVLRVYVAVLVRVAVVEHLAAY